MPINIAMDGPVGAGKSSVADAVAARLGILHLDTGAMYRAMGLAALQAGLDLNDEAAVTALCAKTDILARVGENGQQTLLNGVDVSTQIRTEEAGLAASSVSRFAGVRRAMVALQQGIAAKTDLLMDGRDIGTVVLPNAPVKIYLTASAEERARRRWEQNRAKGGTETYEQVLEDLKRRDVQDMSRAVDPLRPADDAVIVDTTGYDFAQSVDYIVSLIREKEGGSDV